MIDNPPEIIQIQSSMDIIMMGAIVDDPPRRYQRYRRLPLAQCDRYLSIHVIGKQERQRWWNYYGRDQMLTCEVERGGWKHYNRRETYYRMELR
jgi:hypothetical protein